MAGPRLTFDHENGPEPGSGENSGGRTLFAAAYAGDQRYRSLWSFGMKRSVAFRLAFGMVVSGLRGCAAPFRPTLATNSVHPLALRAGSPAPVAGLDRWAN